jgi:hypothetical protein
MTVPAIELDFAEATPGAQLLQFDNVTMVASATTIFFIDTPETWPSTRGQPTDFRETRFLAGFSRCISKATTPLQPDSLNFVQPQNGPFGPSNCRIPGDAQSGQIGGTGPVQVLFWQTLQRKNERFCLSFS